jgi:urease accessory protein
VFVDTVVLHPNLTAADFGRYESSVAVTTGDGSVLALDVQLMATLPRVRRAPRAFGTVYIVGAGLDTTMTALSPNLESLSVLTGEGTVYVAVSDLPNGAGWAVRLAASDGGILRSVAATVTALVENATATGHIRANRAITKQ